MTPEPKDVQLAREIITIIRDGNAEHSDDAVAKAQAIVDAHEANLEAGRTQAEERRLAQEETARRWPELAADGLIFKHSEYSMSFRDTMFAHRETEISIDDDPELSEIRFDTGDDCECRPCKVVLALIDAAGRNTTADRLSAALSKAKSMLIDGFPMAALTVITEALEASND